MPIEFSCKGCVSVLKVPDEYAGKQARCPKCQTLNLIQAGIQTEPAGSLFDDLPTAPPYKSDNPFGAEPEPNVYSAPMSQPTYGASPHLGSAYAMPHRGGMVLTFGILSVALCNFMLIPGILAWIIGSGDLKKMHAGVMDPAGRGLTQTGMIMGIIMTCLSALFILFYIGMIVLFLVIGISQQPM